MLLQSFYCMGLFVDLRDDKQFFIDHPGAFPISTAQVVYGMVVFILRYASCLL